MPDETQTTTDTTAAATTPTATTATPATAPAGEPLLTQSQVNAIVAKRLAEDRARREPTPMQAPPAVTPQPVSLPSSAEEQHMTPKQMRDELNELKLRSRFDKQALKRGIDGDAADDLYELFKAQKPSNDSEWFEAKAARFGLSKGQSAAPTAQTASATAPIVPLPPVGPPISDKGSPAPGGVTNYERELVENPVGMSAAAYAIMVSKHGEEKARRMRIDAALAHQGNMRVTVK